MAPKGTNRIRIRQSPAPLLFPIYSWEQLHGLFPLHSIPGPHTLDFIRHGESVGNAQGLVTGSWDAELTQNGIEQARYLSTSIRAHYDLAYCSVLTRSIDTLRFATGTKPSSMTLYTDQRINERSLGVLEGKGRRNLDQYAQGDFGFAPPGGESYLQLTRRLLSFLVDLLQFVNRRGSPAQILISTHAGPLRVLSGVLEEVTEPREVLARDFSNARLYSRTVGEIHWPKFLPSPEYLDGR
jgi:2,3-bisphosphoglycerate-dependent phosphoglycerate mutase/probable phosphoglycerate mutase